MKKILIILSVLLFIFFILFQMSNNSVKEKYFNRVELSENNVITNNSLKSYYDTIISVGLDESEIEGIHVVVSELSEGAKQQFSGELQAHVRYYNGVFYLFVDDFDRNEAIEVVSHEIIHMSQYVTGVLSYENGYVYWNNNEYDLGSIEYDDRPWEIDAFNRGGFLSQKIQKKLVIQ